MVTCTLAIAMPSGVPCRSMEAILVIELAGFATSELSGSPWRHTRRRPGRPALILRDKADKSGPATPVRTLVSSDAALAELRRVLKPGGRLIASVMSAHQTEPVAP